MPPQRTQPTQRPMPTTSTTSQQQSTTMKSTKATRCVCAVLFLLLCADFLSAPFGRPGRKGRKNIGTDPLMGSFAGHTHEQSTAADAPTTNYTHRCPCFLLFAPLDRLINLVASPHTHPLRRAPHTHPLPFSSLPPSLHPSKQN